MKRLIALLLFVTPLAAQTADLRTSIDVSTEAVAIGTVIPYTATIENLGPDTATTVRVLVGASNNQVCLEETIPALAPGQRRRVNCQAVAQDDYETGVVASAFADPPTDPQPANNQTLIVIPHITPPDLDLFSFPPHVVDAGLPFTLRVGYLNRANTAAENVVITVFSPHFRAAGTLPQNCTFTGSTVTCTIGDLPGRPPGTFPDFTKAVELNLVAPDVSNADVPITIQIRGDGTDFRPDSNLLQTSTRTYRTFFVTNSSNDGGGSLRQAILDTNDTCREHGFCKIAFRIPPGSGKWITITPQTALPVLAAPGVDVDGLVQARYFSDTNDVGPEIEISGGALREGNAFTYGCDASFRGMAINGFPGTAIESVNVTCPRPTETRVSYLSIIERNYLGTDPTGMTAVPNMRGIHLGFGSPWFISDNVISGNLRSGIFVDRGAPLIQRNMIGVNRVPNAGLGNGASGIYIGPDGDGTDARDNYIGFNAHFGIALHAAARYNAYHGNSFQYNVNQAIDFGMDGPTDAVPEPNSASGLVHMPEITFARYDPVADETLIEGSSRTNIENYEVWVNLYSNDEPDPSGYGEGQYYIGAVKANRDHSFRLHMKGRPLGRWISATTTRINIIGLARSPRIEAVHGSGFVTTTSEFGRTVELVIE